MAQRPLPTCAERPVAKVGEGQLRSAVLVARRRHQLVDVLLQVELEGEIAEEGKKRNHRQPALQPVPMEVAVDSDEWVHCMNTLMLILATVSSPTRVSQRAMVTLPKVMPI